MKKWTIFLAMLANAMLLGLVVLVILDARNPFMAFLTSTPSHVYLLVLAAVGIAACSAQIAVLRRGDGEE